MNILVTTLGKASKDAGGNYRSLTYRFADGFAVTSAFFMQALLEYQKHQGEKPDKVLVLGTESSMWDALLNLTEEINEPLMLRLERDADAGAMTKETLALLSQVLTENLQVEIACQLIPAGVDKQEQAEILRVIAEQIPGRDTVTFDLTHGYRTLPVLQMLAIFYLKQIQEANISGIYYGAADMRDYTTNPPTAPVIKLDFIPDMLQWLTTLPLVEVTGRYGQLKKLLPENDLLANELEKYSLSLRTNQTEAAHQSAGKIDQLLEKTIADPSAELYRKTLRKKFNWSKRQSLAEWQILLAQAALRSGDLLRAVVLLREARVSVALKPKDQANKNMREEMEKQLQSDTEQDDEILLALRNTLAHAGELPKTSAGKIAGGWLQNEGLLRSELKRIADMMFQKAEAITTQSNDT